MQQMPGRNAYLDGLLGRANGAGRPRLGAQLSSASQQTRCPRQKVEGMVALKVFRLQFVAQAALEAADTETAVEILHAGLGPHGVANVVDLCLAVERLVAASAMFGEML